jgi:hypothetical protein
MSEHLNACSKILYVGFIIVSILIIILISQGNGSKFLKN